MLTKKTNQYGGKGRQRDDNEDRTLDYRKWRLNLPRGLYTTDVDQVEWRIRNGEMIPVALLELTRIDKKDGYALRTPSPKYFAAILDRYENRDTQKKTITHLADKLEIDAYIVGYLENLSEFYVYNLSKGGEWETYSETKYKGWLSMLGEMTTGEARQMKATLARASTEDPFEL